MDQVLHVEEAMQAGWGGSFPPGEKVVVCGEFARYHLSYPEAICQVFWSVLVLFLLRFGEFSEGLKKIERWEELVSERGGGWAPGRIQAEVDVTSY